MKQSSILIVDDTQDNVHLLTQILTLRGYKVHTASEGKQALEAAATISPDLILLDIMMPGMDGYTVCERLKAKPETAHIPMIFISALNEPLDKVKAFALGGVDYLTKPFQMEEILARVDVHLTLRKLQMQLEEANARLAAQNHELQQRNAELQEALMAIKTLSGLVPICAWCGRKIQDEAGNWIKVENYIEARSAAKFTHGICPDCLSKWKP